MTSEFHTPPQSTLTSTLVPWRLFRRYIEIIDSEGKDFIDLYGTDSRIDLAVKLTQAHISNDVGVGMLDLARAVEKLCKIQSNKK